MYKRRDWLHLHGEDGGASDSSDSDSDSDSDSQHADDGMAQANGSSGSEADSQEMAQLRQPADAAARSGSSDDDSSEHGEGSPAGYESEVSEPVGRRRLEDLSEEDFSSGGEDEDLEEVKRSWLAVEKADPEHKPAGQALKCRACSGKLLLNALALQQHLASKRHLRNVKGSGEEPTASICFADQLANDQNVETHQERMQRLQQAEQRKVQAAAVRAMSKSSGAAKKRRREQRKAAATAPKSMGPKKRLGKRQRQALREGVQAAAPSGDASSKQQATKRQKLDVPGKQKKAKRQKFGVS